MRKKHGLTPLHFFKNEKKALTNHFTFFWKLAKIVKKVWTNPFTFFENGPKMKKKHGLTPLHFFENGSEMRKALTNPFTFF